jgi:amino acid transporter
MFAACLAIQNVTTRYVYSMSVDGVFPRYLGIAHDRHRSPHRSSVVMSVTYFVLEAVLVLVGLTVEQVYSWFAGLASLSIMAAMAITSFATVMYFRRHKASDSSWKTQIAPGLAAIGLTVCVYIGVNNFPQLIGGSRTVANIMIGCLVAAFVVGYALASWLRVYRPEVFARIGRQ